MMNVWLFSIWNDSYSLCKVKFPKEIIVIKENKKGGKWFFFWKTETWFIQKNQCSFFKSLKFGRCLKSSMKIVFCLFVNWVWPLRLAPIVKSITLIIGPVKRNAKVAIKIGERILILITLVINRNLDLSSLTNKQRDLNVKPLSDFDV